MSTVMRSMASALATAAAFWAFLFFGPTPVEGLNLMPPLRRRLPLR